MTDRPKIHTASWFTKLPEGYAPIGISRGVPRGRSGYKRYDTLNPGRWFSSVSYGQYLDLYNGEILGGLVPELVVRNLLQMAEGRIPALLCWEPPEPGEKWCHRGLVSVWLYEKLQLEVYEFGQEHEGCGHCHPKLHPSYRKKPERPPFEGLDRSAEILPHVGKYFRLQKKAYQVVGVHPEWKDQCIVSDGKSELPIHADLLLKHVE